MPSPLSSLAGILVYASVTAHKTVFFFLSLKHNDALIRGELVVVAVAFCRLKEQRLSRMCKINFVSAYLLFSIQFEDDP